VDPHPTDWLLSRLTSPERSQTNERDKQILAGLAAILLLALVFILDELLPGATGAQRFYDRGIDAYKERKYDDAKTSFSRAIDVNSNYDDAYFARALAHRRLNQMDEAVADYAAVMRLKPDRAAAYYNRGLIYSDLGDPERALADFNLYVRLKPSDPDGFLRRAEIYRGLGDFPKALAERDALVRLSDKYTPYYVDRALVRRDDGDFAGALRDLDAAIAIAGSVNIYLARGRIRRESGDTAGAIADFTEAISFDREDPRPYIARGETLRQIGRGEDAKVDFDAAIKRSSDHAPGYAQRGLLELLWRGDGAAAGDDLAAAVTKAFAFRDASRLMNIGIQVAENNFDLNTRWTEEPPVLALDVPFYPAIYYFVIWRHLADARVAPGGDADLETTIRRCASTCAGACTGRRTSSRSLPAGRRPTPCGAPPTRRPGPTRIACACARRMSTSPNITSSATPATRRAGCCGARSTAARPRRPKRISPESSSSGWKRPPPKRPRQRVEPDLEIADVLRREALHAPAIETDVVGDERDAHTLADVAAGIHQHPVAVGELAAHAPDQLLGRLLAAGEPARRDLERGRLRRAARIAHDHRMLAGDLGIALTRLVLRLADRARVLRPVRLVAQAQPAERVSGERIVGVLGRDLAPALGEHDRPHVLGRLAPAAARGVAHRIRLAAAAHGWPRRRAWIASISARVSSCGRLVRAAAGGSACPAGSSRAAEDSAREGERL
jgi:tetratricopeptide (TPR) repeat protein